MNSTNGQICFGILLDDDVTKMPWYEVGEYDWLESLNKKDKIEIVNVCSDSYPIYIVALRKTFIYARRGYPVSFLPFDLEIQFDDIDYLINFCKCYDLPLGNEEPRWWLSNYCEG